MARQILVALRGRDRIQQVTPILQKIAKPGTKVTFLLPYPVNRWAWLRDHWVVTESTRIAMFEGRGLLARYSWDEQMRLAKEMISSAREALSKMGVEVTLMLKACLNSAVRQYFLTGEFDLLLMSAGTGRLTMELVRLSIIWLRQINRSSFSAFRLYHPQHGAHRRQPTMPVVERRQLNEGCGAIQ